MSLKQPGVPIALALLVVAAFLAPLLIDMPVMAVAGLTPEAAAAPAPPAPPAPPAAPAPPARVAQSHHAEHDHDADDDDDADTPEPRSARGWLGVRLGSGGRIDEVTAGGAAEKAGLQSGDRIISMDGQEIDSASDIMHTMRATHPGDSMKIKVLRDEEVKSFTVKLGDSPEEMSPRTPPPPPAMRWHEFEGDDQDSDGPKVFSFGYGGMMGPRLGVQIHPMSEDLRAYFKAPRGVGLLVDRVMEETPAAKAGLKAGDVIVKVDGRSIMEMGDIASALSDKGAGDKVAVEVIREGSRESFDVTLQESPAMMRRHHGDYMVAPGMKPGRRIVIAPGENEVESFDTEEIQRAVNEAVRKAMEEVRHQMQDVQERIRLELQNRIQLQQTSEESMKAQQDLLREQQRMLRNQLRGTARARQVSWEL